MIKKKRIAGKERLIFYGDDSFEEKRLVKRETFVFKGCREKRSEPFRMEKDIYTIYNNGGFYTYAIARGMVGIRGKKK